MIGRGLPGVGPLVALANGAAHIAAAVLTSRPVTDCYIDYFFALKTWNRIINKLNYVNVYKEKFSKMSLHEYICAILKMIIQIIKAS